MPTIKTKQGSIDHKEMMRYIVNGVFATVVHFSILTFNIEIVQMTSAGIANFIAAIFGITASFLGSRYYVYRNHTGTFVSHAAKFALLYVVIAILHGFVLYLWTDIYGLNWRIGFLVATLLQVTLSYIGNKLWVFTDEN